MIASNSLMASSIGTYAFGAARLLLTHTGHYVDCKRGRIKLALADAPRRISLRKDLRPAFDPRWLDHVDCIDDPAIRLAVITGFLFMLRVGEYTTTPTPGKYTKPLRSSDVRVENGHLYITLRGRKNDPDGIFEAARRAVPGNPLCPVARFNDYVAARAGLPLNPDSPAFLHTSGPRRGLPIRSTDIAAAVATIARHAGYAFATSVKTHCLRIGGATAARRAGFAPDWIKQQGGWKSDAFLKYIRVCALDFGDLSVRLFAGTSQAATAPATPQPLR